MQKPFYQKCIFIEISIEYVPSRRIENRQNAITLTNDTENNVCTRVTNCFSAHERVIFLLIFIFASRLGK